MIKKYKKPALLLLSLAIICQVLFAVVSFKYTTPFYESRVFATTGIQFDGSDLHKLNEGAHYFSQTMIGWTKFPNFRSDLIASLDLPEDTELNMHAQERQNFVFTLTTKEPIVREQLVGAKQYLQTKIDEYNSNTNVEIVLTNADYEQVEISRTYLFGATTTLLLSLVIGLAFLFVQKEFFPPKLKL